MSIIQVYRDRQVQTFFATVHALQSWQTNLTISNNLQKSGKMNGPLSTTQGIFSFIIIVIIMTCTLLLCSATSADEVVQRSPDEKVDQAILLASWKNYFNRHYAHISITRNTWPSNIDRICKDTRDLWLIHTHRLVSFMWSDDRWRRAWWLLHAYYTNLQSGKWWVVSFVYV